MHGRISARVVGALVALGAVRLAAAEVSSGPQAMAVKGVVESLNLSRGLVTIRGEDGAVTLNALPAQLADLAPGDLVGLRYARFAGVPWLLLAAAPEPPEPFQARQRLVGEVSHVDVPAGTVTVQGTRFRSHPQLLAGLSLGYRVNVEHVAVGGVVWAYGFALSDREQEPDSWPAER